MSRYWLGFAMALALVSAAGFYLPWVRGAVVAEWSFANCVRDLNCGNCLLGFAPDASCSSWNACIAFKGTATSASFSLCTPSTNGNHACEVDNSVNPNIFCQGFYRKCGCFDGTTRRCPHALCDCQWYVPDGPMQFHVNATCI